MDALKKNFPVKEDLLLAYKFATYVTATNKLFLKKLAYNELIPDFPKEFTQHIVIDYDSESNRKFELAKKKVRFNNS